MRYFGLRSLLSRLAANRSCPWISVTARGIADGAADRGKDLHDGGQNDQAQRGGHEDFHERIGLAAYHGVISLCSGA